jgi:hypothetical protein
MAPKWQTCSAVVDFGMTMGQFLPKTITVDKLDHSK